LLPRARHTSTSLSSSSVGSFLYCKRVLVIASANALRFGNAYDRLIVVIQHLKIWLKNNGEAIPHSISHCLSLLNCRVPLCPTHDCVRQRGTNPSIWDTRKRVHCIPLMVVGVHYCSGFIYDYTDIDSLSNVSITD
jgi:hypothetical protein